MFRIMSYKAIKFLTLLLMIVGSFSTSANVLEQEEFKTHLRWTVNGFKEQILIKKGSNKLTLQTLDKKLFTQLISDLLKVKKNTNYIKDFEYNGDKLPAQPAKLVLTLADDSVELFTFYKDQNKKHIIDFWINKDLVTTKEAAVAKKPEVIKLAKPVKKIVKKKLKPIPLKKKASKEKIVAVLDPEKIMEQGQKLGYRDFRYGAAFIWDYHAFIPPLKQDVNLTVKTPAFLYEVKDREFKQDPKEAHMQLTINFYRKEKWGLMTRSINLYENKYGKDKNAEINDFMKAVSLVRNVIKPKLETSGLTDAEKAKIAELEAAEMPIPRELQVKLSDKGTFHAAINMLSSISDRTDDYELKKAVSRYVLQNSINREDFINSLQLAKKLYVASTENFDDDMIIYSSKVILYSLAQLKQLDKIKEFLSNKAVIRVLPKQEGMAYISFVNLMKGKTNQVIAQFRANEKSMTKPIHPAILYNTAESYFRVAQYQKAIKLYDQYIVNYSFFKNSSNAHLRIALSYDLLEKDTKKVLNLYKTAINRASTPAVRYEAKLRYVGLRLARKLNPTEEDKEIIAFLDQTPAERKSLGQDLRKLLWLVRLRTMINTQKYNDAMAYLSTIPLEGLRKVDSRTFDADGAEVVLGLIKAEYLKQNYAKAVKIWEVYKEKYENKVAKSSYANFIVTDSYLKLGLESSFNRAYKGLESLKQSKVRTFPKWVKSHKDIKVADYLIELELGKYVLNKDWGQVDSFLNKHKNNKNINYNYYKGLVNYHQKKYNSAVINFEKILVTPNIKNFLSPKQSKTMLTNYIESLYQLPDQKRFRKNVSALVNDLRRNTKEDYKAMLERFEYLYVESLFGEVKTNHKLLLRKASEFAQAHSKSTYINRIKFLKGVAFINTSQEGKGKKLLEDLINNNETPEYLKGLARSELSTLALKNKTL